MLNKSKKTGQRGVSAKIAAPALGCLLFGGAIGSAMAVDDGRDIIGPHEYDLPTHFGKPLNFFVQYADIDSSDQLWNQRGDKVGGDNADTVVGLTKYVRAWVPSWAPDIGLAYEAIVPEVGIRDTTANTSSAGISDPLTGPVVWFKPLPNITIGQDFLIQVPIGDSDVGGGNVWNLNSAFLYNINFCNFNFVGDIGVVQPLSESTAQGSIPGTTFYTDDLLGYQVTSWVEPFVGTTYENVGSSYDRVNAVKIGSGHETLVSGGLYVTPYKNQSFTLRYSRGVSGENHALTNEFGLKYVFAW